MKTIHETNVVPYVKPLQEDKCKTEPGWDTVSSRRAENAQEKQTVTMLTLLDEPPCSSNGELWGPQTQRQFSAGILTTTVQSTSLQSAVHAKR